MINAMNFKGNNALLKKIRKIFYFIKRRDIDFFVVYNKYVCTDKEW